MEVEIRNSLSPAAKPEPMTQTRWPSCLVWTLSLFIVLWVGFLSLYRRFPYVKNGADLVFAAKLKWESNGPIFPADHDVLRVLIFGNSKILAGFVPSLFDEQAADHNLKVSSFNSGFPGSDLVLPPLKAMCERGQAPNILLLTLPWRPDPPRRSIFRFIPDDHLVITQLFPFRELARDFTSFLLHAPSHGGIAAYYREAQKHEKEAIIQRGHYLIAEQNNFPGGRLPETFHLQSDQPNAIPARGPIPPSAALTELNHLITQYHMDCYYVPYYLRIGEAGAPPITTNNLRHFLNELPPANCWVRIIICIQTGFSRIRPISTPRGPRCTPRRSFTCLKAH